MDLPSSVAGVDLPSHAPRCGVVDLGSNSVRLVVFEGRGRNPVPVFNEKAVLGLGRGLQSSGLLNEENQLRTIKTGPDALRQNPYGTGMPMDATQGEIHGTVTSAGGGATSAAGASSDAGLETARCCGTSTSRARATATS